MKLQVYQTKFTEFVKDSNLSVAYMKWLPETADMTEEEFKEEVVKRLDTCRAASLKKILADDRNFAFLVTPSIQEWLGKTFVNYTVHKHAMILPAEIFSQVSIESVIMMRSGFKILPKRLIACLNTLFIYDSKYRKYLTIFKFGCS